MAPPQVSTIPYSMPCFSTPKYISAKLFYRNPLLPNRCQQRLVTRMSSSAANLRHRIASVQSAEKIVSALRLVAAARIRASSNAALRSRPFAEELQTVLAQLIELIKARGIDIVSEAQAAPPFTLNEMHGPILADPFVQRALMNRMYLTVLTSPTTAVAPLTIVTVITADRKFCGSYNKDVLTRAKHRLEELIANGITPELVIVGRIARGYFARQFPDIPVRLYMTGVNSLTAERVATTVSQSLLSYFVAGGVQRVEIIYTRFVSLITTVPSTRTLLPLTPTGIETVGDEIFQLTVTSRNGRIIPQQIPTPSTSTSFDFASSEPRTFKETLYSISDQEAILLLNSMLPMYFTSQVIRIIREAVASEQVTRLAAMTAATDNARELIASLQTQYHKERQARITTELIEVISNTAVTSFN